MNFGDLVEKYNLPRATTFEKAKGKVVARGFKEPGSFPDNAYLLFTDNTILCLNHHRFGDECSDLGVWDPVRQKMDACGNSWCQPSRDDFLKALIAAKVPGADQAATDWQSLQEQERKDRTAAQDRAEFERLSKKLGKV